jgi:uncharacterized oxidoreductase
MDLHGNTILITGGGSGIGRGLAEAFHRLENKVIISGRRESLLQEACTANPGMEYTVLDVRDRAQVQGAAEHLAKSFPALNCLINNAGVQRALEFSSGDISCDAIEEEIGTNFTGLVQMCAAFLPQLRQQARAALINVSSGLGLTPLSRVPVYSATKAAVHAFTMTLRHQLRASSVEVIELIPPSVATDLRAARNESTQAGPRPMPLEEYIAETFQGLERGEQEIAVGTARRGLAATSSDEVRNIFAMMNH